MNENDNALDKNALKEVGQTVEVTPEDVRGAAEFWPHFEVPMPDQLKVAIERFCESPSLDTQRDLKIAICYAVGTTNHEAFNDDMFKEIVDECRRVACNTDFDKALEDQLMGE